MEIKSTVTVIGGGINGLFTTLDLALRGVDVTLIERGDIGSETSGRFHGLLHSGARYAVTDPDSAKECIQENSIIPKIAPHAVRDSGGVFLGITDDDLQYTEPFLNGLEKAGIEHRMLDINELLQAEPYINRDAKVAIWVPDKVAYGYDLMSSVAITASLNGARIMTYNEAVEFIRDGKSISGIKVADKINNGTHTIKSDLIVNTTGPWAFRIIKLAGLAEIPIMPTAGIMAVFEQRINNMVLNRLRPPSDADIVMPYGGSSILGTTATIIEDPDNFEISDEDIGMLVDEGAYLVPKLKDMKVIRSFASVRPLIKSDSSAREATREFRIIDHEKEDGVNGLISAIGGKFTTGRLVGEKMSDIVTSKLGIKSESKTKSIKLIGPSDIDLVAYAEKAGLPRALVKSVLGRKGSLDEDRYSSSLYILLSLLSRGRA